MGFPPSDIAGEDAELEGLGTEGADATGEEEHQEGPETKSSGGN